MRYKLSRRTRHKTQQNLAPEHMVAGDPILNMPDWQCAEAIGLLLKGKHASVETHRSVIDIIVLENEGATAAGVPVISSQGLLESHAQLMTLLSGSSNRMRILRPLMLQFATDDPIALSARSDSLMSNPDARRQVLRRSS